MTRLEIATRIIEAFLRSSHAQIGRGTQEEIAKEAAKIGFLYAEEIIKRENSYREQLQ